MLVVERHFAEFSERTLLLWVPGPTTRWAPGTTQLVLHGT
jgi:hypothetical protein